MATRRLTEDESNFNQLAKKYGRERFSADDFDKDRELIEAFKSFMNAQAFKLADDFSNLSEFTDYHHTFLKNPKKFLNADRVYDDNTTIDYTQQLFKISCRSTATVIAHEHYREIIETGGNIYFDKDDEKKLSTEISEKIDKFHHFCINVNRAKEFVERQFPRWVHADKREKNVLRDNIKTLYNNLEILNIDIKLRNVALHFISNYDLHQVTKFKADVLLSLDLPKIDSHSIANKIVKNLIHPYGSGSF